MLFVDIWKTNCKANIFKISMKVQPNWCCIPIIGLHSYASIIGSQTEMAQPNLGIWSFICATKIPQIVKVIQIQIEFMVLSLILIAKNPNKLTPKLSVGMLWFPSSIGSGCVFDCVNLLCCARSDWAANLDIWNLFTTHIYKHTVNHQQHCESLWNW